MPKNREQSFEINYFRIIYGTCRPGGDRKREYYFLGGYDISSGNGHNNYGIFIRKTHFLRYLLRETEYLEAEYRRVRPRFPDRIE